MTGIEANCIEKLLLVEDDPLFGKLIINKLESELNIPVVWTKTLAETLQLFEAEGSHNYFAAVLDFVLPDAMNGEIIDCVMRNGIPPIVFTGSINPEIRKFVWSKTVVDYILKDDTSSLNYLVSTLQKLIFNRNQKILLVDDSLFFRKVLSELLYVQQYRLAIATNAQEALDTLKQHPDIKLVITDYNMPGMDGCQLCKTIRESHNKEDLAIIGISSEGDETMAARFIKSGANDFIIKQSFIREEFYCRVAQCIENIDLIRQTKLAAIMDFLTGLYNRRYFFEQGEKMFLSAEESNYHLCCAMLDIDHFKHVNDTYGHDVGDLVLKKLAGVLKAFVGKNSLVARLGGEEFCILISSMDEKTIVPFDLFLIDIENQLNALRSSIQNTKIILENNNKELAVTVSMGASFNKNINFSQMLKIADERLYDSKNNGRNQVTVRMN